jgi:hypothetical protein
MDEIFSCEQTSYFNRLLKGFIMPFIFIWIAWLVIYLLIIPDHNLKVTMSVLLILTVFFAVLTIPKFKDFLLSIEYSNHNIIMKYVIYDRLVQEVIPIKDFKVDLKNAWERGVTYRLLFYDGNRLLINIYAKKQTKRYNNKSFMELFNKLKELQNKN